MMHDATGTARADATELPLSLPALREAVAAGRRFRYVHFWGHAPRRDGTLGPSCLSQWWPAPFTVDGVTYATAEHWMMAGKARLFGDTEAERRAVEACHPREAKAAGRAVRGFDDARWQEHRFELVVEGSVHKFGSDPALGDFLRATRHRVLVEASPLDRIWGIGLAADDERAEDPARWRGPNLLGFALMEARRRLDGPGAA
ncbi:NADAR family protein [Streptomyces benahoarensis]|uniref:NADAR family protein n=1 Tax=Streptomyces benahoarensis TaxID=2595054 RepID=A0A553ZFM6_9ACTN|nr:NADAR family protein [Streptomyces benahoarensis]TSB21364.1 NADAR family protein [Streptomyces benahoarensis]TSB40206.1 NADAR family protein [Streptomyces benahoarensis]